MSDTYVPTQAGGVPAIPNNATGLAGAKSPDPRPLVTASDYVRITGDSQSDAAAVTEALADAIADTAKECDRTWAYGQYTENLHLYKNGMVFPSACPIDVAQQIIAGSEVFDPPTSNPGNGATSVVQGAGIWVGWFTPLPWMPVWSGVIPPQTVITYWGGYAAPSVPNKLKRIWCRVAWYYLHPVTLPGLPMGAKSTGVGGVSLSGDLSIVTAHDPQLKRDLRRWTRRQARSWQS